MAEPELVAAVWKTATYGLIAFSGTLLGVIVKMAHWWVKAERPRVTTDYQKLNTKVLKALDRSSDHMRDLNNKLDPVNIKGRTYFDFNGDNPDA